MREGAAGNGCSRPLDYGKVRNPKARSSVVEHYLDMVVVGGSIPLAPTNFPIDTSASGRQTRSR